MSMSNDAKELLARALRLPQSARASLAGQLLVSLDDGLDTDSDEAWREEIRRRVKSLDDGTAKTVPWEDVERALLAKVNEKEDA